MQQPHLSCDCGAGRDLDLRLGFLGFTLSVPMHDPCICSYASAKVKAKVTLVQEMRCSYVKRRVRMILAAEPDPW